MITFSQSKGHPIVCVGDVHGEFSAFQQAVHEALAADAFIVQAGDLIDAGPDSVGCLRLMLDLIERGQGLCVRGNHEAKLYQMLTKGVPEPPETTAETLRQIDAQADGEALKTRFLSMFEAAPYWFQDGNTLLVHGAFHPDMLSLDSPEQGETIRQIKKLKGLSLYGETNGKTLPTGMPVRTYRWVDRIPDGITVIVGHDIRDREQPFYHWNDQGGCAVFLDTGSGKGGRLSTLRL